MSLPHCGCYCLQNCTITEFDPVVEVQKLKQQTQLIRKRPYFRRQSRLDKYKGELLSMYRAGARPAELQRWLKAKRINVVLTTVLRYLKKNG